MMLFRVLVDICVLLFTCSVLCLGIEEQVPFQQHDSSILDSAKRIAIIGAGAAGSSTAYHLRKLATAQGIPLNITIYEKYPYIGGRSTTVDVLDDPAYPVELGASIFVQVNEVLYDAAKKLDLPTDGSLSEDDPGSDFSVGIWDGQQFVFKQPTDGLSWLDKAKLLWRYGMAPMKTQRLMNSTVSAFLSLYEKPLFPWMSLTAVTEAVGLLNFTGYTGQQVLDKNGIGEAWAREVIQASTRVNYGQNLATIHGLEAMVCMATDNAMTIRGGNWRIFHGMVQASKATTLLKTTVDEIETSKNEHGDKTYVITSRTEGGVDEAETSTEEYDIVILAAPAQFANITMTSSDDTPLLKHSPDKIPYVSLHVTLLAIPHRLSPKFFGIEPTDNGKDASSSVPSMVLTTLPTSVNKTATETGIDGVGPAGFWSVNHLLTIQPDQINKLEETLHVYKIFSPAPINATFLSSMFDIPYTASDLEVDSLSLSSVSPKHLPWYHTKTWFSYPYLYPRLTFEDIRLDSPLPASSSSSSSTPSSSSAPASVQGSFWYTSGIESFISTMETSALSGKNVATLIVQGLVEEMLEGVEGEGKGELLDGFEILRPWWHEFKE